MHSTQKHRVRPLYKELASAIEARRACLKPPVNQFGLDIHEHTIDTCMDLLPSGSGWDAGTKIDLDASHADKLVLYGSYHHMDESGGYDGYTEHRITVTPSLTSGFNLRISGSNRSDIKEYLHQMFDVDLRQDISYWLYLGQFPQFKVSRKWVDECTQEFSVLVDAGTKTNEMIFQTFKSLGDAQSFAADLMEAEFYKR